MSPFLGRRLQGKFTMLPSFAAAMAFYFLVSLVPFLVVVSRAIAGLFSANLTPELLAFLRDIVPPESRLRVDALGAAAQGAALATLVWAYCGAWGVLLGAAWAVRADET